MSWVSMWASEFHSLQHSGNVAIQPNCLLFFKCIYGGKKGSWVQMLLIIITVPTCLNYPSKQRSCHFPSTAGCSALLRRWEFSWEEWQMINLKLLKGIWRGEKKKKIKKFLCVGKTLSSNCFWVLYVWFILEVNPFIQLFWGEEIKMIL